MVCKIILVGVWIVNLLGLGIEWVRVISLILKGFKLKCVFRGIILIGGFLIYFRLWNFFFISFVVNGVV